MIVDCLFSVYQSLPIGVMGLVLAYRRTPSSLLVRPNQIDYIRLLSVMGFYFGFVIVLSLWDEVRKLNSLLFILFKVTATWSGSLACIMYSAMTVFVYRRWGIEVLLFQKYYWAEYSFDSNPSDFVKKGTKLEYTYEEKTALAVFILIIIFSIIEIILAAAIAKTSGASHQAPQMLQPSPMHYMYYQVLI